MTREVTLTKFDVETLLLMLRFIEILAAGTVSTYSVHEARLMSQRVRGLLVKILSGDGE
jgi:hypothetical protein